MGGVWSAGWIDPSAHHQEKITVSIRHWYLSLCMGGVWSAGWIDPSAHHQGKLLYLCDNGICHSV